MAAMDNPEFRAAVQRPDEQIELTRAALLFARDAFPDLDIELYLNQLAEWAADAQSAVARSPDPIDALNHFLFDLLRFTGNRLFYNDPLNSYLNKVIDRRTGLPITLAVIYLDIAWRLGLPVAGVGLPGHFIVRTLEGAPRFIDVFHQGKELTEGDCRRLVSELSEGQVAFDPSMLAPVGPRLILGRMLNNLKNAYLHQNKFEAALSPVERLIDLQPDEPAHLRDLGLLHYQLDRYDLALPLLNHYTVLAAVPTDDPVRQIIGNIQTYIARLN